MPFVMTLVKMTISLISTLLTQGVLKQIIVLGLEKVALKTKSDVDDKLLAIVKKEWGVD